MLIRTRDGPVVGAMGQAGGMPRSLPVPLRVAAGVVGSTIDYFGRLPGELPAIGVSAVGQAFRFNLRVRQELAALVARGDELLSGLGGSAPVQPEWATFDEDDSGSGVPASAGAPGATDDLSDGERIPPIPADPPGPESRGDSPPLSTLPAPGVASPTLPPTVVPGPEPATTPRVPRTRRATAPAAGDRPATPSTLPGPPPPPDDPLGLRIGALRDHLARSDEAAARALLSREESGRARPAYLTLLGNRVATLSGSASS